VHVQRNEKTLFSSKIKSLRFQKEDIPKAVMGEECGAILDSDSEFAIGDIIVAFRKI
jgi:translation initiation factor IF-2